MVKIPHLLLIIVFPTMSQNSSKLILPSSSLSAKRIVLSTICCNCVSFKFVAHHHLQHLEKLPIGDVPVIINIIYSEGKSQLAILVTLHTELRHSLNELLEINFSVAVIVKYFYHPLHQRVLLKFWQ